MILPSTQRKLLRNEHFELNSWCNGEVYILQLINSTTKQVHRIQYEGSNLPKHLRTHFQNINRLNMFFRRGPDHFRVLPQAGKIILKIKKQNQQYNIQVPLQLDPFEKDKKQEVLCGKNYGGQQKQSTLVKNSEQINIKKSDIGGQKKVCHKNQIKLQDEWKEKKYGNQLIQFTKNQKNVSNTVACKFEDKYKILNYHIEQKIKTQNESIINSIQSTKTQLMSRIKNQQQQNQSYRICISKVQKILHIYEIERNESKQKFKALEKEYQLLNSKLTNLEKVALQNGLEGRKRNKRQEISDSQESDKQDSVSNMQPKSFKENQSIRENSSYVGNSSKNFESAFLRDFWIVQKLVTYMGQNGKMSHLFLRQQIKGDCVTEFQIKIRKSKNMRIRFGVASRQYINYNGHSLSKKFQKCIFYRLQDEQINENSWSCGTKLRKKMRYQTKLKQGDRIRMSVQPEEQLISWKFSSRENIAGYKTEKKLRQNKDSWVCFIEMKDQKDSIEIIPHNYLWIGQKV